MKTFIAALTLSTLIAAPAFVQSANAAQRSNGPTRRDQTVHKCSALESKNPHTVGAVNRPITIRSAPPSTGNRNSWISMWPVMDTVAGGPLTS
jgi:hypothetical protein